MYIKDTSVKCRRRFKLLISLVSWVVLNTCNVADMSTLSPNVEIFFQVELLVLVIVIISAKPHLATTQGQNVSHLFLALFHTFLLAHRLLARI